jgi:hypothetical protein
MVGALTQRHGVASVSMINKSKVKTRLYMSRSQPTFCKSHLNLLSGPVFNGSSLLQGVRDYYFYS